jgi:hypothetical protein
MKTFEPQDRASSLHSMAKKKYRTQERLYSAIEQHAEPTVISLEFKPKEVANTLWAF